MNGTTRRPAQAVEKGDVDVRLLGELQRRLTGRLDRLDHDSFYRNEELLADIWNLRERIGEISFVPGDAVRILRLMADLHLQVEDLRSQLSDIGFAPNAAELLHQELRGMRAEIESLKAVFDEVVTGLREPPQAAAGVRRLAIARTGLVA